MSFKIYNRSSGIVLVRDGQYVRLPDEWDTLVNSDLLYADLAARFSKPLPLENEPGLLTKGLRPPIGRQEVWAAGVTYYRSREARMKESQEAGGGSFYDRVYDADRPELFFKATASRTVGHGGSVQIRPDSTWDVPEPELTLFITTNQSIVGYSIGNDMSSRSIEGENPLYLPQAKTYDRCAGLGPCLYVPERPIDSDAEIELEIRRSDQTVFDGSIGIDQMKRGHAELAEFLFRCTSFPNGCYLMTGTGIVPPDSFTLENGDEIRITIEPIGTLINYVG